MVELPLTYEMPLLSTLVILDVPPLGLLECISIYRILGLQRQEAIPWARYGSPLARAARRKSWI